MMPLDRFQDRFGREALDQRYRRAGQQRREQPGVHPVVVTEGENPENHVVVPDAHDHSAPYAVGEGQSRVAEERPFGPPRAAGGIYDNRRRARPPSCAPNALDRPDLLDNPLRLEVGQELGELFLLQIRAQRGRRRADFQYPEECCDKRPAVRHEQRNPVARLHALYGELLSKAGRQLLQLGPSETPAVPYQSRLLT